MNVAIFASAFYPHVGGVEEVVRQVANEYRKRGIGVIVITNRWPRSLPRREELDGIPIYRLALRVPEGSLKARVNYGLTRSLIRRQVIDIVRRHKADVLHVHCVSSNGYYALLARRKLMLPLVVTTHGERTMDAGQIYQHSAFQNNVLRELLAEADHITACSRETLDDVEQYGGTSFGSRASVIYSGIAPRDFDNAVPYPNPRPYVLGMGRLVPQKGFDLLIEAFAKANLDVELLIAGEGPERESLERLVASLGLQKRVRLVGRADRPKAVSLFAGCRFFVMPSRQEPMGIVNLEAMALGKAVIAPRIGGVPEIVIDNETGLLVPGSDVTALAQAMVRLDGDERLRLKLGAAGKVRAQKFGWPEIGGQYLDIYRSIIASRASKESSRHASIS